MESNRNRDPVRKREREGYMKEGKNEEK